MVVLIKKCLMLFVCTVVISSCEKLFPPDELTLERRDFTGTQLRLDGYYYHEYATDDIYYQWNVFLYRNGITRDGSRIEKSRITELEGEYLDNSFEERTGDGKTSWGVFQIENNTIKFEEWHRGQGRSPETGATNGVIINDTTFLLTSAFKYINGKEEQISLLNMTYHFKQFSPKLDSINEFIK